MALKINYISLHLHFFCAGMHVLECSVKANQYKKVFKLKHFDSGREVICDEDGVEDGMKEKNYVVRLSQVHACMQHCKPPTANPGMPLSSAESAGGS